MYRLLGDTSAYSFFNALAVVIASLAGMLFIRAKLKVPNIFARYIDLFIPHKQKKLGKVIVCVISLAELYLLARGMTFATIMNKPFGELVGTGVNYFGGLFSMPIVLFAISSILLVNPLKNADIVAPTAPIYLFFVKIACFCNGCCWGIPWEYGPYNHHYDHPGNQVPVQAIEALWAILIFIFLLIYRKKAKPGTVFPMYMILYSATRFCSEFFRREENVLWIFKTYHLLCIAGVLIGLLMLLIVKVYGERIAELYERPYKKIDAKIAQREEQKALELAQAEKDRLERAEKAKLARAKAKARKK